MDLNLLYAQHQRSLMQATAAWNLPIRTKHLAATRKVANKIGAYQLVKGAPAAAEWLRRIDHLNLPPYKSHGVTV